MPPPEREPMMWNECESKLKALVIEVARSSPQLSPQRVEEFLRTEREIRLVEELAAFVCEHFGFEADHRHTPVKYVPRALSGRTDAWPVPPGGAGDRAASVFSGGSRRWLEPLRRLTDVTQWMRGRTTLDAAPREVGQQGHSAEAAPRTRERRRAPRALRQWPVEVGSRPGRIWTGRSVDIGLSGMRIRFDEPLDLRWRTVITLDPANPLGPIVTRFALVREIVPSREYAIRFLDLFPQSVERLSQSVAA
jgi:PilZ domain